jgi:hypothetical protein
VRRQAEKRHHVVESREAVISFEMDVYATPLRLLLQLLFAVVPWQATKMGTSDGTTLLTIRHL